MAGDLARYMASPSQPLPPLPPAYASVLPQRLREAQETKDLTLVRESIREGLARYPDDPGLKTWSRLIETKVKAPDSKALAAKIDLSALGTREPEALAGGPNLAGMLALGGGPAAGPQAAAAARGFADAGTGLSAAEVARQALATPGSRGQDLRGAQAPVLEAASRIKLGDHGAAEKGLERHLAANPADKTAWGFLALTRYHQKRYEPSIHAADQALGLDRRDERARGVKTLDLLALDRFEEAEAEASLAIELNPRNAHAYFHRSEARVAQGRPVEGLADLKMAAELDAQYAALYDDALSGRRAGAKAKPGLALPGGFSKRSALWVGALGTAFLFFSFVLYRKRGDTSLRVALREEDHAVVAAAAPRVDAVPQGFSVVRTLGQGGMGVVYEAVDLALQRTVALKKMRDEVAVNPRERARFLKEARVVAGLRHPNIVEIYSIQDNADGLFLVFERVPGVTLHEKLGAGALPPAEAVALLRQVAAALDYAHAQGVVHQDLKPANVMVHGGGVKVMDFGIARRVQETLSTMSRVEVAGTPAYMAPEQEQGAAGPAADLFALGVCAYETLTGRLPFPNGGLMAKAQGLYRPATDGTPLPKAVDAELGRALSPRPEGRHASATAFVDALARALS
ncbi:MAG: protein kinase [Elusimicrobiota bacterium]|nr:protein kinase [Elusimicrobiota bacterium]